jgi:hypothetical protein
VKTEWEVNEERGREREREQWISGVGDGALEGFGNGMGWKWPLGKKDTRIFQVDQMIRTNKMLIKWDIKSWVGLEFIRSLCCDFCSLDSTSHHTL